MADDNREDLSREEAASPEFYEEIGEGGSESSGNFRSDPERASEAGREDSYGSGGGNQGDSQDATP